MSRSPRTLTFACALFALSVPAISHGQTTDPDASSINPGSVSVGFNTGMVLGPGAGYLAIGPNVTFNASRKRAIQISTSLMRWEDDFSRDTTLLYAVQYRRTFRDAGDSRSYWTVGGAGLFERSHFKEQTYLGKYTSPARSHTWALPPVAPIFGFGTEKFVTSRLAIRGDVVISFLVMRAAVGVSVPLGRLK